MKTVLIGLVFIIIGLAVLAIKKKESNKKTNPKYFKKEANQKDFKQESSSRFYKKTLLSKPEQTMFHRLITSLPNHIILAEVAFSQMIGTKDGTKEENNSKFATARQKVADFVICDKSFNIITVIEIDDSTHDANKDEARDQILLEAGIPTIRWRTTNLPDEEEIKQKVSSLTLKETAALQF